MAEAAEIAKLRLFLKLAAQLDDPAQIEPLPDLDFNIKSGNLLVGIADRGDITRRFSERGVLPFGLEEIEDAVESIAVAYEQFVAIQDSTDDQHVLQQAKGSLQNRIDAVADQADRGLHKMRGETGPLEEWKESHAPFHWFIEFPTVWRNGGFDVIIGNPPYIGLKGKNRNQFDYKWIGYETSDCPDLYAVCTERASTLLNAKGRFAMIVMHSLCFHKGFLPLRSHLRDCFTTLWVSSYAMRPDSLFSGSAGVRNSIILAKPNGRDIGVYSSTYRRWWTKGRSSLFSTLEFSRLSHHLLMCGPSPMWPFIGPGLVFDYIERIVKNCQPMNDVLKKNSDHRLGYKTTALYSLGIYVKEPPTVDPTTRIPAKTSTQRSGWLYFANSIQRDLAFMCLVGRWGYLWWLIFGDEFDVTRGVLAALPCDIKQLEDAETQSLRTPCDKKLVDLVNRILDLASELQTEMPKHLKWMLKAGVDVGRYDVGALRHITDEADWLLAQAWGLTREQYEAAGNLRDRMTFGNRD